MEQTESIIELLKKQNDEIKHIFIVAKEVDEQARKNIRSNHNKKLTESLSRYTQETWNVRTRTKFFV